MGDDGFCGKILVENKELRDRVCQELADALNQRTIPGYLRIGRMVALSKDRNSSNV